MSPRNSFYSLRYISTVKYIHLALIMALYVWHSLERGLLRGAGCEGKDYGKTSYQSATFHSLYDDGIFLCLSHRNGIPESSWKKEFERSKGSCRPESSRKNIQRHQRHGQTAVTSLSR